jgi:hypothetical protein
MSLLARITTIRNVIADRWALWLSMTLGLMFCYYATLLIALMVRFQSFPNYLNVFSWPENVMRIIRSTPSLKDTLLIIKDEWWLEIGFMNYDYGIGISEWSLFLAPVKILSVIGLTGSVAAYSLMYQKSDRTRARENHHSVLVLGFGSSLVAFTSITMYWVVCCSSPTWVVGLAMMGLGVSASLWIEPVGVWINLSGFLLVVAAVIWMAGRSNQAHCFSRS